MKLDLTVDEIVAVMRPLLQVVGVRTTYLDRVLKRANSISHKTNITFQRKVEAHISTLYDIYMEIYDVYHLPHITPQMWVNYKLLNIKGLDEQLLMQDVISKFENCTKTFYTNLKNRESKKETSHEQ